MGRSLENNLLHIVETTIVTRDIVGSQANDMFDPPIGDENAQTN